MHKYKKLKNCGIWVNWVYYVRLPFTDYGTLILSQYTSSSIPIMVLMVIIGLITCKFAASDLNNHYRLSLKHSKP